MLKRKYTTKIVELRFSHDQRAMLRGFIMFSFSSVFVLLVSFPSKCPLPARLQFGDMCLGSDGAVQLGKESLEMLH